MTLSKSETFVITGMAEFGGFSPTRNLLELGYRAPVWTWAVLTPHLDEVAERG